MLLECKDVIKIYPSPIEGLKFPALRGLNLKLDEGEIVSIIGPSGAGKTTLLRMISAFDEPSSGEIWFDGELVNQFSEIKLNEYRKNVGIMYQQPRDNLIWGFTALQNVLFPMEYSGRFLGEQEERAYQLLEKVGLKGKEDRKPAELSGGEQQRVAIAVALANGPKLLLADEPTGELDSTTTHQIIDYFRELNQDLGVSIIVVTHDKRFYEMTETTYRIRDGRLTASRYFKTDHKGEKTREREEALIMDEQGNIRLPEDIAQKIKSNSIKAMYVDGEIKLVPIDRSSKDKQIRTKQPEDEERSKSTEEKKDGE